jgi:hypothetical protein
MYPTVSHIGQIIFSGRDFVRWREAGIASFPAADLTSSGSPSSTGAVGETPGELGESKSRSSPKRSSSLRALPLTGFAGRDVLRAADAGVTDVGFADLLGAAAVLVGVAGLVAGAGVLFGSGRAVGRGGAAAGLADARVPGAGAPPFIGAPQNGQTSASSSRTDWRQEGQDGRSIQCLTLECACWTGEGLGEILAQMKECEQSNSSGGEMLFTDPYALSLEVRATAHKAIATLTNE